MKRWIVIVLCVACLLGLTACGGQETVQKPELESVRTAGVLKIGVAVCPPFSQKDDQGQWSGFDVELARMVCQELGVEPAFVEIAWDARSSALEDGQVDCLWSGLSARSDLLEQMDFSQSYLASRPVLVETEENTGGARQPGATIAVEAQSACESAVSSRLNDATALTLPGPTAALEALLQGKAQGAVVDVLVARAYPDTTLNVVESLDLGTQEFAVAFRKDSDLTAAVDTALDKLQTSGVLSDLAQRYGMTDSLVVG